MERAVKSEEALTALRALVKAVLAYQFAHESDASDKAAHMDDAVDDARKVLARAQVTL